MARIPDEQLDQLKQDISIQRLVEAQGIELKPHGHDLIGRCPFHDDHTPSLVISPKNNLWHCLGACQTGGSVIDWVMKVEGISFRHAVELLQTDYQPSLAAKSGVKRCTIPKLPTTLVTQAENAQVLQQVVTYYHQTLKDSPEALAYLMHRGLTNAGMIDTFQLGFANRTLGYRLPAKTRKEGAAQRGQLQRLGLIRPSGHEHFTGSVVVPIVDAQGQVCEMYGRKINDHLRPGTPLHLYLPGPHQGVWNLVGLQSSKEVILCESLIDALTFWCAGYRNVTASYGIEGFTADYLEAFQAANIERVLIAYDRDAAGDTAAEKLATKLLADGFDCYRIQFPKGMDANEYALQVQPAWKSLGTVIRAAHWLGKGQAKTLTTVAVSLTTITAETPVPTPVAKPSVPLPSSLQSETPLLPAPDCPASAPIPAAGMPPDPSPLIEPQTQAIGDHDELVFTFGDRRYRVRGLAKNLSADVLKVNILVSRPVFHGAGEAVHVDTFDLYQSRPRHQFITHAAVELGVTVDVVKVDLGQLLLQVEASQAQRLEALKTPTTKTVPLSDEETQAALHLLKAPDLLTRIGHDFARCGLVGEETNTLVTYLAALSRKLERPLAVTIQSSSAAGKSSLMDAVLAFVPEEERIKYSAMTGQSLFYMGQTELQHKVLAIVEEEGASHAAYALKLLQSEGELTIASTGKDAVTGNLETREYRVEGPVMIMLTTTAIDLDEELLNRCLVLSVDESRTQTQAIHARQRAHRTLDGLVANTERHALRTLHQHAQRLLQPLAVVNPYAQQLTFVSEQTRTRRDHEKYLTLIDTIALLHQHQRPIRSVQHWDTTIQYVEVTLKDIEVANLLAHEVLGRTLDELPPQTRQLLQLIVRYVDERTTALKMRRTDYRFSRRELRTALGWSHTQLRIHLDRLVEWEYLLVHRGSRGQSFVYELLYDGDAHQDNPHLSGLIDVTALRTQSTAPTCSYDKKLAGEPTNLAGSKRPQNAPITGGWRDGESPEIANGHKGFDVSVLESAENALIQPSELSASYRTHTSVAVD
jgi:DNA primase catalytic core